MCIRILSSEKIETREFLDTSHTVWYTFNIAKIIGKRVRYCNAIQLPERVLGIYSKAEK